MPGLNRAAQRFLNQYGSQLQQAQSAAALARDLVEKVVRESGALVHVIAGRAKGLDSLRGKLRRKSYRKPESKITDLIGVRVITYYRDEVEPAVAALQRYFDINATESTDKRVQLGLRAFGYRSVHLIARLKRGPALDANHLYLQQHWFEIQIRSILEHAWAEIEHEVVYKSGIVQPDEVQRRFAALAGTLELLDNEFVELREERNALIDAYVDRYLEKLDWRKSFDVARLLGFLEAYRKGRSWRQAAKEGQPFAAGLDASCVEALKSVGLGTPSSLIAQFRAQRFRYNLRVFASLQGISVDQVSHLASVVLAVLLKDETVVRRHFPEMMYDPAIIQLVERRTSR
ncbi:MAG: hypothetical protein ABSC72_01090 [Methylovirgula sp.]|jgi:ppGpp synthetase/RelA/SpoT-type nucleotidyltranferase